MQLLVAAVLLSVALGGALVVGLTVGRSPALAAGRHREMSRSEPLNAATLARVRRRAAARQRWLESPSARAQRLVSRMKFHGLGSVASQRLLKHDFASRLAGVSANPAASLAVAGSVVRYIGDDRALVRTRHGLQFDTSSVPLRVAHGASGPQPVSLELHEAGAAYVAVNPLQSVSVSRRLSGGVTVGSAGIQLIPQGADVVGSLVGDQSVFFANIAADEDASIAPTIGGVDLSTVLRSRLSPGQISYRVVLPTGDTLQAHDGGAVVVRAGKMLASVPAPVAWDAQGSAVPVSMSVSGDDLLLSVRDRGRDVAYPILVDPEVVTITESAEHWRFSGDGTGSAPGSGSPLTAEVSGTYPGKEPCYAGEGECGGFHGEATWEWELEAPLQPSTVLTHFKAEFDDVAFSLDAPAGHLEDAGGYVSGHCSGDGGAEYWEGSSATEVTTEAECQPEEDRRVQVSVQVGQDARFYSGEYVPQISASASVSVGAILVSESLPLLEEPGSEAYGTVNEGEPARQDCFQGEAVNCVTGDQVVTQSDLEVGGRGPGLELTRTYNSQLAVAQAGSGQGSGPFGYGWTSSYSAHLQLGAGTAIVHQDDGSTVSFREEKGGAYVATSPLVQAALAKEGADYVYTLPDQTKLVFEGYGRLIHETDRNGNAINLEYEDAPCEEIHPDVSRATASRGLRASPDEAKCATPRKEQLAWIEDAAGRKITLAYDSEGVVESATDPMGHTAKYGYESGNLTSVTEPGETSPSWQFKYASHALTSQTEALGHSTTFEYDGAHRATKEVDAMGRERTWEYTGSETSPETHIKEPNGAVTVVTANAADLQTASTAAFGTSLAAKSTYEYNSSDDRIASTDPDGHETKYGYDAEGNRTSEKDANGNETKWTYDSTHDVKTTTTPDGETTTIKRDGHGNPEVIERPAPGSETQKTTYVYDGHGDLESMTGPLEHTWKYEYDSYGDRVAEVDPEGDKRTWGYNEDSRETSAVSPRGNVSGGKPAEFTTTIERNAQGQPVKDTEPEAGGPSKPSNRVQASISGVAQEAQTLTSAAGIWEGTPSLSYGYQWEHCNSAGGSCANISGATSATYLLGSGYVGDTVRVVVTATNSSGSATSTSEATAVVVSAVVWGYEFGSGSLHHPDGAAIDAHGRVWVTSSSGEPWLQVFSREGERLSTYGATGTAKGDFEDPNGIAINKSTGAVYVSDGSNDRIQEYSEAGVAGKEIGKKGSGAGEFEKPVAVALDSSGDIWVADYTGQRIDEFNKEGTFLKAFGWGVNKGESKLEVCTTSCKVGKAGTGEGELDNPAGVEYAGEDIHVVDSGADRLQKFTTAGVYVGDAGSEGSGSGQLSHPTNETTEVEGNSYVADAGNNRVEEFTGHGEFVDTFGSSGTGQGQFSEPGDVAINPNVSEMFVTDIGNNRVEKWDSTTLPAFSATIGAGDFTHPGDVAVDPKGRIWATNAKGNPAIQVFSASGTREATYGEHSTEPEKGKYVEPDGITINQSTSNVYVADGGAGRIDELSEEGAILKEIGSKGTGAGQMADPVALALDPSGDVYVADRTGQRIEEFNKEGTFVKAFGFGVNKGEEKLEVCTTSCKEGKSGSALGQFNDPTGIVYTDGYLHIVDGGNDRLEKFSLAGAFEGHASGEGSGNGQLSHPLNVTASAGGNMYVADAANNRIEEFTPFGAFVAAFGSAGSGGGQLNAPSGVAVGPNEELYVADAENNRLQKWLPAGSPADTALPAISGEVLIGQTLSASTGTWSALPIPAYAYQWRHCNSAGASCSNISGATGATYTLSSGDVGYTLRVVVTATNSVGSAEGTSLASEVVPHLPTTEYVYNGDGNAEAQTDPNGNTTKYSYNADNELTKTEEPNKTTTETEYDAMGQVVAQTDGNKHKTEYKRNLLEEVTEEINPSGRKTKKEYDAAGNLKTVEDPEKRTTTYTYDPGNRLTEISYSSGNPATVKYEYDKDGDRTKMTDGTGTTNYEYDELGRLTETENGHKEVAKYEYNLANEQIKITYPNGKAVTRAYDKDGRLEKVTDWSEHATKFSYNPNSDLTTTAFPSGTSDEDKYTYNNADEMSEVKMLKGTETLASLAYTRDNDGQVKTVTSKGLPGEEKLAYEYDSNNRLTKGAGTAYEYDAANDPTKIASNTYKYNEADELESATGFTYAYNEDGQRTKTTPTTGPATTYGYDQAGNLISVERPEGESKPKIEDTYAYNGNGLRTSQTISGTTTHMAWDESESPPLILGDGANSYIYGPENLPIEQINNEGTPTYLHHDQQGSTRLLTSSAGTITGSITYTPYGAIQEHTGTATTPLGYDAQYTNSDTGLIYLRARTYDPSTAQFLSVDPLDELTQAPYSYAEDDPLSFGDATGTCVASAASYRRGASKEECEGLLEDLVRKAKEVHARYNDLFQNRQRLGLPEVKRYVKTFEQKQSNLREEFKRFGTLGCEKKSYGLQVPEEVSEALDTKINIEITPV